MRVLILLTACVAIALAGTACVPGDNPGGGMQTTFFSKDCVGATLAAGEPTNSRPAPYCVMNKMGTNFLSTPAQAAAGAAVAMTKEVRDATDAVTTAGVDPTCAGTARAAISIPRSGATYECAECVSSNDCRPGWFCNGWKMTTGRPGSKILDTRTGSVRTGNYESQTNLMETNQKYEGTTIKGTDGLSYPPGSCVPIGVVARGMSGDDATRPIIGAKCIQGMQASDIDGAASVAGYTDKDGWAPYGFCGAVELYAEPGCYSQPTISRTTAVDITKKKPVKKVLWQGFCGDNGICAECQITTNLQGVNSGSAKKICVPGLTMAGTGGIEQDNRQYAGDMSLNSINRRASDQLLVINAVGVMLIALLALLFFLSYCGLFACCRRKDANNAAKPAAVTPKAEAPKAESKAAPVKDAAPSEELEEEEEEAEEEEES